MLGRMNILEAPWATAEVGHGLLGDMGRVAVQHHADDGILGVVLVGKLKQSDELDAAVAIRDIGKDMPRVQVNTSQDGHDAETNILVVTPNTGCLARYRRQIGCGQSDGLNTRLPIDSNGVDGVRPSNESYRRA